jgi:hypothetical protein
MPHSPIDLIVLVIVVWLVLSVLGAPVGYQVPNPLGTILLILLVLVLLRGSFGFRRWGSLEGYGLKHGMAQAAAAFAQRPG